MKLCVPENWQPRGRGHRGADAAMDNMPQVGEKLEELKLSLDPHVTVSEGQNRDLVTVLDQTTSEACMFHAAVQLIHSTHLRMGIKNPLWASRSDLWAKTREYEGTFPKNVGVYPSNAYMMLGQTGFMAETDLAWDPSGHAKPSPILERGEFDRAIPKADWAAVRSSDDVILLTNNRILCGWGGDVTYAFCHGQFDASKPVGPATGDIAGGHEMVIVWHDPATNLFLMLNSWSPYWGLGGFFWATRDFIDSGFNKQTILRADEITRIVA